MLLKLIPSENNKKKWTAVFKIENKIKKVSFGDPEREDYLSHKDIDRRKAYLRRHQKDLKTNNPLRPGYLAYYVTWSGFKQEKRPTTDLRKLIKLYNNKFFKK